MGPATQAMQRDDSQNPAMLWVQDGEALFQRPPLAQSKVLHCHGDTPASLRGTAARYPAFDAALGRPVSLAHRINLCRQRHQQAEALAPRASPCWRLKPG
jgi:sulfur-oxidizing protein SoxA